MATPLTRREWLAECEKLAKVYEDAMTNPKHTASSWKGSNMIDGTLNTRAEASSAEPVAWIFNHRTNNEVFMSLNKARMDPRYWTETPLYAHPPAAPDTVTLDWALVEDDFAPIWDDSILLTEHKAVHASVAVGGWLSAALDDPNVCDAMKADVNRWFSAGFLYLDEVRKIMQAHRITADRAGYERGQRETVALIVAWLRNRKEMTERYIDYVETAQAADAIEAGEWK